VIMFDTSLSMQKRVCCFAVIDYVRKGRVRDYEAW